MLLVFCIIRVLGGSFLVAAQEITPASTVLYIGGFALQASGLSPLLICTRGLLHSVFQTPDGWSRYNSIFRLLQLLGMVALIILTIIGISVASSSSSSSTVNIMRRIMRRTGVILFCRIHNP
ncbi:hypothetical protein DEU56DRAFT_829375 [Suillus clintonianus]|uniref:uncharacterized protein n=1 Tax=Suillus clintonianus TaxID=1904413 RepID=UPI001B85D66E|nr:uncharacterized protein DEU56DRAFT_829375 [Suillus clintonianus]KAG2123608.1 hypothetical protein DEU56DRAFT_829375 [Suillus clintonianus]